MKTAPVLMFLVMSSQTGLLLAQQLYAYPTNAQSETQQRQDRFECYEWAVQQTGFDPVNPSPPAALNPTNRSRMPSGRTGNNLVSGALGGAVSGALIGAIAGEDVKDTALAGAAVGGTRSLITDRGNRDLLTGQSGGSSPGDNVVSGAVDGAATGAHIGAISGQDAGDTALAGAAVGGAQALITGGENRSSDPVDQAKQRQRDSYNRAWGACMSARKYTVR